MAAAEVEVAASHRLDNAEFADADAVNSFDDDDDAADFGAGDVGIEMYRVD